MKDHTKAYMAGVLDGDGHLGIQKHGQYSPSIQVCGESKSLMEWIVLNFGGSIRKEKIKSGKDFYKWILYGKNSQKDFVEGITPFVFIKRSQAEILQEFLNINRSDYDPEKRESYYLAIRKARSLSSVETDMRNKLDNKLACAYAAGLVDTDGHINLYTVPSGKSKGSIRTGIEIVNIYRPILDELARQFGGHVRKRTEDGYKTRYQWFVTDMKSEEKLLLAMLPYMIVKREKAENLLKHLRERLSLKIQPELIGDYESVPVGTLKT